MNHKHNFYRRYGKRALDLCLAAAGLVALAPVFLLTAAGVKLSGPGPIFYSQQRIGRYGRTFRIWKFRSMIAGADRLGPGITAPGDTRITRIGAFLRRWKLDELPQLWNVVRGEMSLVGPRPELPAFVELYTEDQREVLALRPGITDVASIEYRHEETLLAAAHDLEEFYIHVALPRKLILGREYVNNLSLAGDCLLITRTVLAIFAVPSMDADGTPGEPVGRRRSK